MRRQIVLYVQFDEDADSDQLAEIVDSFTRQVAGYGLAGWDAGMCCEPVDLEIEG